MSRSRNLLHTKHLQPFKEWLTSQGIQWTCGRAPFEILRIKEPHKNGWNIIYERSDTNAGNTLVHYTVHGYGLKVVHAFLREYKDSASLGAQDVQLEPANPEAKCL